MSSGGSSQEGASSSPPPPRSARQAGRVHDEVARIQQQWRDLLAAEARAAASKRELPDGTDVAQIAFELGVILAGTNLVSVLHNDLHVISRARTAIRTRLAG